MDEFQISSGLKLEIDFIKNEGFDNNFAEFMQKIGEFIAIPFEYELGDAYESRSQIFINVMIDIEQSGESQDVLSKIDALFHEIISQSQELNMYVTMCHIDNLISAI